ncbi:hypothetical protein NL676_029092 [Syzygium grande]|nr:hypothetical protein NL676_029092 [Syzygium grande]
MPYRACGSRDDRRRWAGGDGRGYEDGGSGGSTDLRLVIAGCCKRGFGLVQVTCKEVSLKLDSSKRRAATSVESQVTLGCSSRNSGTGQDDNATEALQGNAWLLE